LEGFSPPTDYYFIENNTTIDIVYDLRIKEGINRLDWIDYFVDGVLIGKVKVFSFWASGVSNISPNSYGYIVEFYRSFTNTHIGVLEKFLLVIEDLLVYDSEGYTIMTMEDITADTFSVEDYGRAFVIHITQEVMDAGKRKYAGTERKQTITHLNGMRKE
jgi:hypothetical protein